MHEFLVTRGDVRGVPFEVSQRIFVDCNVVLVHPGVCHQVAQFTEDGHQKCLTEVRKYCTVEEILEWIDSLNISVSKEVRRFVETSEERRGERQGNGDLLVSGKVQGPQ